MYQVLMDLLKGNSKGTAESNKNTNSYHITTYGSDQDSL